MSKHRRARPGPSLKRSANGTPTGPLWRYAVHFRQPERGVFPSWPAWLNVRRRIRIACDTPLKVDLRFCSMAA
jgi:hypothetical protein